MSDYSQLHAQIGQRFQNKSTGASATLLEVGQGTYTMSNGTAGAIEAFDSIWKPDTRPAWTADEIQKREG